MGFLGERIAEYGGWRRSLADAVLRYAQWLDDAELSDASLLSRVDRIVERLGKERVSIAFVAEFSRGKSELINAIFFSRFGRRIVPSGPGRTTMCPTELLYDPQRPTAIRLLPIETRLLDEPVSELRDDASQWNEREIDPQSPESLRRAFESVQETLWVDASQASLLGFYDENDPDSAVRPDGQGRIEVPRWRHAIVNWPHPLLEQGLVVLDTPGLNAIGAEPELTLKLIPGCDAVLFVLAADAGVTMSDLTVWREHIATGHSVGRYVVLNKVDSLWDGLKDEVQIQLEIARQVGSVAQTLQVPNDRVYPVSAQKALLARVNGDASLLKRSRIADLEYALGCELVPQHRDIVREHVEREFGELHSMVASSLAARRRNLVEQQFELNGLRGKNRGVMDHMAARIRGEREEFEKSLRQLQALRSVFARHSQSIRETMCRQALNQHVRIARDSMKRSTFSSGLRDGMSSLLAAVRGDLDETTRLVGETGTLMSAMYRSFSAEHGLALGNPALFSTQRYYAELERIEQVQRRQFGAITLVTTSQWALMRRFFESVAARLREIYDVAGRELESWLRAVMAPIESQVREHQGQLKRRLESVRRMLDANGTLEARLAEIEQDRTAVEQRIGLEGEYARRVTSLLAANAETLVDA
ncbi:MAG: dynamin family protein [Burkholderiaceae bacterium]|nr:dynamin family protein [Burkholderiaceae bacterium]